MTTTWKAYRKPASEQDKEAARQSVRRLNEALDERFGHLPDVQIVPWISDIHLHDDSDYVKLSSFYSDQVDTGRQFELALEEVRALRGNIPALIVGGDMTDYCRPGEWFRFRKLLDRSGWTKPVIPAFGNHDNKNQKFDPTVTESLRAVWEQIRLADWPQLPESGELYYSVSHDGITYIVIDTMRDHKHRVSDLQREWLRLELQRLATPAIVVCHRHFLSVGNWVDETLAVRDKELWQLIDASPLVLGVLSGHVHDARLWTYREKLYATFPSTAHGIGTGTGWGGIVLHNRNAAAVFYKELYGEGYEYYKGQQLQEGRFVFMTPERFEHHKLCDPRYWPRESAAARGSAGQSQF